MLYFIRSYIYICIYLESNNMTEILLCVIIVLVLLYLTGPYILCDKSDDDSFDESNFGFATNPASAKTIEEDSSNYNDYLQNVGLDSTIQQQHKEWVNDLMLNYQPRMYSIRDDCDDGETKRWGLLKKDYGIVINEKQNISIPSGRTCTQGDGGNSRFGGYGIGLCPVQQP